MSAAPERASGRLAIAGGSLVGHRHRQAGRNNQDAFSWRASGQRAALVVCDGCGSEPHSELGARFGAAALASLLERRLAAGEGARKALRGAEEELLSRLAGLADALGPEPRAAVTEHLLFTIVGAVVDEHETLVFACGDGAAWLNGAPIPLGPFPGNAPPYLGYRLLGSYPAADLSVVASVETDALESLMLGSDGLLELLDTHGPATWLAERHFHNRDGLRRSLARLARASRVPSDDATVVVARRAPEEGS